MALHDQPPHDTRTRRGQATRRSATRTSPLPARPARGPGPDRRIWVQIRRGTEQARPELSVTLGPAAPWRWCCRSRSPPHITRGENALRAAGQRYDGGLQRNSIADYRAAVSPASRDLIHGSIRRARVHRGGWVFCCDPDARCRRPRPFLGLRTRRSFATSPRWRWAVRVGHYDVQKNRVRGRLRGAARGVSSRCSLPALRYWSSEWLRSRAE